MQWVCYIEIQGLYAAAARAAGLAPADRPVVVLKEGAVFDGCREAFTGGLVLGAPERQALRDAPRAALVPLEQIPVGQLSRAWWDACAQHTPYVEPVGPHQVFLALPSPGSALTPAIRGEVKALVEQAASHGFVAFAGAGSSRLVARAAAQACREAWLLRRPGAAGREAEPPQVLAFVEPGQEERFLAPLPLTFLPAPPELQRRLSRLGMCSIGEAARIPEGEWLRQLGPLGHQVARWSRGLDGEPVKPAYPPRTLERRVQFQPEARERDHLEQVLARSAVLLANRLDTKGEGCQQVALALEPAEGTPVRVVRTLAKLQHEVYPLQQALMGLLGEGLAQVAGAGGEFVISAMAVELGLIGPMPWQQLDLWDDQARRERQDRIQRALALLHERFPVRTVRLGFDRGSSFREQMLGFADPYRWVVGGP